MLLVESLYQVQTLQKMYHKWTLECFLESLNFFSDSPEFWMLCHHNRGTESHYDPINSGACRLVLCKAYLGRCLETLVGNSAIPLLTKFPSLKL